MISLYGLAAGLVVGWLRRGRLSALADVQLRLWGLCLAALVLHRLVPLAIPALRGGVLAHDIDAAVFYAALTVFALANRIQPGAYWLLVGGLANAAATIWAGGRMPVWTAILGRIPPATTQVLLAGGGVTHVAMAAPVGVGWLGDVLAVPAPLPPDVISIGDIAIAVGAAVFIAASMNPRRPVPSSLPS